MATLLPFYTAAKIWFQFFRRWIFSSPIATYSFCLFALGARGHTCHPHTTHSTSHTFDALHLHICTSLLHTLDTLQFLFPAVYCFCCSKHLIQAPRQHIYPQHYTLYIGQHCTGHLHSVAQKQASVFVQSVKALSATRARSASTLLLINQKLTQTLIMIQGGSVS